MSQSYQNLASDQICKVQNDKKLISFHDRLRAALPGSYAQIHAKGEFSENNHKVHSLIAYPSRIIPTAPGNAISSPGSI